MLSTLTLRYYTLNRVHMLQPVKMQLKINVFAIFQNIIVVIFMNNFNTIK